MSENEMVPYFTDPTGREHLLTGETSTIGRTVESDIVVTSKRVSREHARFRREHDRHLVEDLDTAIGTLVNGERITVNFSIRVGSGTGPTTCAPVRSAVSTICRAD